ncbi:MAG: hypothetical protein LUF78_13245 [Clostridiales bacterium]|nr:hypothetical protein [Clostridiales bacterium]
MNADIEYKKCDILLLFVLICGAFFMGSQIYFIFSTVYLCFLFFSHSGKIIIPRIPGFIGYLLFIVYASIVGLMLYNLRNVLRDLYYILPTVVWIFIGTQMSEGDETRTSLLKTLYLYGGIVSASCFCKFIISFSLDFSTLKNIFGSNLYQIGFILPMMIYQVFICGHTVFSKNADRLIICLMSGQILLCFGRIGIIQPLSMLAVILFICIVYGKYNTRTYKMLFAFSAFMVVALLLFFYVLPDSLTGTFMEKVLNSFSEVDTSQTISSIGEATNNWRAYEIQAAQKQWKNSNLIVQLFGYGMGKGTKIDYVPNSWSSMVVDNELPLLHNGFYTLLSKGGLFAVLSCVLMFLGPIVTGIRKLRYTQSVETVNILVIVVSLSVAAILNTWVVRGPVEQGAFVIWAILIGHIYGSSSEIHVHNKNQANIIKD